MVLVKFDQHWPIGFGDILIRKYGDTDGWTMEPCYTMSPCEPLALVSLKQCSLTAKCFSALYILCISLTLTLNYEGESIKNQPNLFLGEIDLFFFDVIAL